MDVAKASEKRRELLRRLVKTTAAADQLARRRFIAESAKLYEEVVERLSRVNGDCPEVRLFRATRRSIPPADDPDRRSDVERLADARADAAAGLRAHFSDLVHESDRVFTAGHRALVGVAVVAAAALFVSLGFPALRRDLAVGAHWQASSAVKGVKQEGVFPRIRAFDDVPNYFFHTEDEKNPHVDIDLGVPRPVQSVEITNRIDCCTDRAKKLEVWLGTSQDKFVRVAMRNATEGTRRFSIRFRRQPARFVRIEVPGKGILHLARVSIFG